MQFTDLLIVHFLFLSFLCFELACFIDCENPPNKCAKMTHQINAPKYLAMATCRIHPRE